MISINSLYDEYKYIPDELWDMLNIMDIISLNHSVRVCEICKTVEKEMGYTDNKLSCAGLFHDIGKYFISTKLLNKRGGLNEIERAIIDSHSYFSYKTLKYFKLDDEISKLALYHHSLNPVLLFDDPEINNNRDITENIVTKSIILRTIDIFEALTTDRPYHRGVDYEEAVETIKKMKGMYSEETIKILLNNKFE